MIDRHRSQPHLLRGVAGQLLHWRPLALRGCPKRVLRRAQIVTLAATLLRVMPCAHQKLERTCGFRASRGFRRGADIFALSKFEETINSNAVSLDNMFPGRARFLLFRSVPCKPTTGVCYNQNVLCNSSGAASVPPRPMEIKLLNSP